MLALGQRPCPGAREALVRALGLDPADVVMAGDDAEADIAGAAEAGLGTVRVAAWAGTWPERLPVRPGRIVQPIVHP